jgi:hypothetical protein
MSKFEQIEYRIKVDANQEAHESIKKMLNDIYMDCKNVAGVLDAEFYMHKKIINFNGGSKCQSVKK